MTTLASLLQSTLGDAVQGISQAFDETTLTVSADRYLQACEQLRDAPGISAAAAFGASLHVLSPDVEALERAVAPFRREGLTWQQATPTLEDVFIHLMGEARDNAGAAP